MGFIYKIENTANGKAYIGQTIQTTKRRFDGHKQYLEKNKHDNAHLQFAWNKYGRGNFEFTVIEECLDKSIDDREIHWITEYNSLDRTKGYNIRGGGSRGTNSEETKLKLSIINSGENHPMYGKHKTEETKRKISEANSGENCYWYGKTGKEAPMFGRKMSNESKAKMSSSRKTLLQTNPMPSGKDHPCYGINLSDKHKQKISDAHISRMTKRNTSGYIGVNFDTSRNKWLVRININGKPKNIGRFDNIIDAAKKYDEECWKLHSNLEYLNFPEDYNRTA